MGILPLRQHCCGSWIHLRRGNTQITLHPIAESSCLPKAKMLSPHCPINAEAAPSCSLQRQPRGDLISQAWATLTNLVPMPCPFSVTPWVGLRKMGGTSKSPHGTQVSQVTKQVMALVTHRTRGRKVHFYFSGPFFEDLKD